MLRKIINESYDDSLKFVGELADFALYYIMWSGESSKDVDLGDLLNHFNSPEKLMMQRACIDLKDLVVEKNRRGIAPTFGAMEVPSEPDFLYKITNISNNEIEMNIIYRGVLQGTVVFYVNNFKVRMKCIYEKP